METMLCECHLVALVLTNPMKLWEDSLSSFHSTGLRSYMPAMGTTALQLYQLPGWSQTGLLLVWLCVFKYFIYYLIYLGDREIFHPLGYCSDVHKQPRQKLGGGKLIWVAWTHVTELEVGRREVSGWHRPM